MKIFFSLLITLFFFVNAHAQDDIKKYVQQNAARILTNHPDSLNFDDLGQLGNAIGDASIVMLGEQDHGDAPTFLAKTRIIKYLHEKKGFNVLAFESDFFALNDGWETISKNGKNIDSFLSKNIFRIWTACDGCMNLIYKYIPGTHKTAAPLQVSGFDNQTALDYSKKNLSRKMDSVMRAHHLPITMDTGYNTVILPLIDSISRFRFADTLKNAEQYKYLVRIKEELSGVLPPNDFWMMMADNMIAMNIQVRGHTLYYIPMNARDGQMAKNLAWLHTARFPKEKIIVWAHNFHISKYAGHYRNPYINPWITMGTAFDSQFGHTTYTLGFTSYQGTAGRLLNQKIYKLEKPARNSFEQWIGEEYDFAFVDFTNFNESYPSYNEDFIMKGSSQRPHQNEKAQWNMIFDGVFFIREMYPCKDIFLQPPTK